MAGRRGGGDAALLRDGWLAPAAEAAAYEGVRRGDEAAFRAVAQPLQPTLRRLAALTTTSGAEIDALVARTWEVALGGLDMFHWQTPFATWVAGLAVAVGRGHAGDSGVIPPATRAAASPPATPIAATPIAVPPPVAPDAADGPADWSDLPWGARWSRSWETLDAAVAALPLPEREVLHAREVERWPPGRVCDVLGLTQASHHRLLADARMRVRGPLAGLVAAPPVTRALHEAQADAVARMLRETVEPRDHPLDTRTVAVFQRWRATRRWRWRLLHPRHHAGALV